MGLAEMYKTHKLRSLAERYFWHVKEYYEWKDRYEGDGKKRARAMVDCMDGAWEMYWRLRRTFKAGTTMDLDGWGVLIRSSFDEEGEPQRFDKLLETQSMKF